MAGPVNAGGPQAQGKPRRSALQRLLYWSAVLAVWGLIFLVVFFAVFARGLPDTSSLYRVDRQPSITYLDRNGALIATRGTQMAPPPIWTPCRTMCPPPSSPSRIGASITTPALIPSAWTRAMVRNLRAGRVVQGGSTLTQQLAKNLFLTPDQNLRRKVQELMLAVWLEMKFSKKEILALYLNRSIRRRRLWDRGGVATLFRQVGQGPDGRRGGASGGPAEGPLPLFAGVRERARRRPRHRRPERNEEAGVITAAQREQAVTQPVIVSRTLATQHAQYFIDWLDKSIRGLVGEPTEDMVVETTLDLTLQTAAERSVRRILDRDAGKGVQQAALVALDGDGRVRAMIGGSSYADSQFNRAVDARRQAGSAWKPFVYLAAMGGGLTPQTRWSISRSP